MNKELMLSLLNRATNGSELLAVLDTLTDDVVVESDTNYMPIRMCPHLKLSQSDHIVK
jgi:hypothetical protein